ncbi:MAG: Rrf2 family transcriptional regulator [Candidatus Cloacimonetes bacterium]|nr:Rrf2 family transcriptional regulator [Candidatus Cloacimonadota bacterium]MDY0230571.1 Rrf2 family transcriptional regulator [Candidatus Cloacimonadaceae bacterium]
MANIVQLSEAASLAIHSMVIIAKSDKIINANQIAEMTASSRNHLAKVMLTLSKMGMVKSLRGPSGGFVLAKKPEEINLLEIYEAIEGKIVISKCPCHKPICPFDKCILSAVLNKATQEVMDYFEKHTLKDYL